MQIVGRIVNVGNKNKVKQYMKAAEEIAAMPKLSYGDTRVNGYWDKNGFHSVGHQNPWQLNKKPIGYVACNTFVWYSLDKGGFHNQAALKNAYKSFATTNLKSDGEIETLKKLGFKEYAYNEDESKLRFGDILWKNGHTGFYYKKGYVLSAHVSKQSIEKCVGPEKLKSNYWKKYYRLPQSKSLNSLVKATEKIVLTFKK